MSEFKSVERINTLKAGIEAITGENHNDLTEAVQALKNVAKHAETVDGWHVDVGSGDSDPPSDNTIFFVFAGG